MGCCLKSSCTNIEGHRGFSSDCQLFSKDIKVLLTLKLKIRVSYKHTLFIAKTLLDNTIKNVNKYIGPILIHYYGLTRNCRKKKLVFVSDLYFLNEVMESITEQYVFSLWSVSMT